jgi:hypothetical protein
MHQQAVRMQHAAGFGEQARQRKMLDHFEGCDQPNEAGGTEPYRLNIAGIP